MSLLNRFSAIISNIEIADLIHDTGIMKQFIVKGLHGLSYILDITQNNDEELFFTFTSTFEGVQYHYKVSINGFKITVFTKDLPELNNFIGLLLSYYEYRFDFDDAS